MAKSRRAEWVRVQERWLLPGLALGAALGCSGDEGEARDNLEKWRKNGPASYTYVVETICFCANVEPTRIVVEDGVVVSAVGLDTGLPRLGSASTMTELLEAVVGHTKQDPDDFEAHYDDELGFLKQESVNFESGSADDEFFTVVSCFTPSTDDTACPAPTLSSCEGEARSVDPEQPGATCGADLFPTGRIEGTDQVCCARPREL